MIKRGGNIPGATRIQTPPLRGDSRTLARFLPFLSASVFASAPGPVLWMPELEGGARRCLHLFVFHYEKKWINRKGNLVITCPDRRTSGKKEAFGVSATVPDNVFPGSLASLESRSPDGYGIPRPCYLLISISDTTRRTRPASQIRVLGPNPK
ncbi:hypothetical protein H6P81_005310 [Aristolochia fimbriata]|uniref:Uncharacterized protein n=1 Tax=Aristolochia fimbriata TaxID=158543 RepID=A0AAV7EV86_ARIFI|nr:hypothetical protein H6P81_005310 [Aristolochia fimbriata]